MAIQHKKKKQDLLIDENSPFTYKEAYNELGVNVNYTMKAEGKKVLLVTSALPEEGKSTVSINLAIAMARAGQKVLLVECDLRAAGASRLLSVDRTETGLAEMLMGKTNSGYAVKSMPRYGIDVITAGVCKTNPTRLLGDRSMGKILSVLKSHYDYVICDAPPVLSVADTSALCHYCDGVLLVVRQDHASAKEVRLAKRRLEKLGAEILGVVMNFRSVSKKNERRYYGYYN